MTKIDWNKPLQIWNNGDWYDISAFSVRNKPEPRYRWLNVYENNTICIHGREQEAAKYKATTGYLHTIKVNVDTGETEKVYL